MKEIWEQDLREIMANFVAPRQIEEVISAIKEEKQKSYSEAITRAEEILEREKQTVSEGHIYERAMRYHTEDLQQLAGIENKIVSILSQAQEKLKEIKP